MEYMLSDGNKTTIYNNTSGYNNAISDIWCGKACQERKAAKQALEAQQTQSDIAYQNSLSQYLSSMSSTTKSSGIPSGMYIIAGLGIVAIIGVSYFAFIKK